MQDIEVYIREPVIKRVLGWLKSELGELQEVTDEKVKARPNNKVRKFRAVEQSPTIPILINQEAEGSAYTCIWFNAANTPWETDAECARAAYKAFSLPVYCDPGKEYSGQDEFLRIDEKGEQVVELKGGQLGKV